MCSFPLAFSALLLLGFAAAVPVTVTSSTLICPLADQATYTTGGQTYSIDCNINYSLGDMPSPNGLSASTFASCVAKCAARSGCLAVAYSSGPKACYLKNSVGASEVQKGTWSAKLVVGGSSGSAQAPSSSSTTSTRSSTSSTSSVGTTSSSSSSSSSRTSSFSTLISSTTSSSSSRVPSLSSFSLSSSSPVSTSTVASSRSSSTSSTSTPSATPVANTGKRGLAYNNATLTKFFSLSGQNSKVSWAYNWYSTAVDTTNSASAGTSFNPALEFVPMLWSNDTSLTNVWAGNTANAKQALAFNEPDQCGAGSGGSCMGDAAGVAAAYKKWMQPLAGRARLGAPAVTNGGAPMGLAYLQDFLGNCTGCQVDFVPVHWYDSATNVAYFKSYVAQAYAAGGNRPLWITEFSGSGTDAQQQQFLQQVLPWLDATSYVERYAWFGAFTGSLLSPDGSGLSAQGQMYNSY